MATFQERFNLAFKLEADRRNDKGLPKLTKTEVWKAAGKSSGAFTHWSNGSNGMDLDTCMKVSDVLHVDPTWLFNESTPMRGPNYEAGAEEALQLNVEQQRAPYGVSEEEWALIKVYRNADKRVRDAITYLLGNGPIGAERSYAIPATADSAKPVQDFGMKESVSMSKGKSKTG